MVDDIRPIAALSARPHAQATRPLDPFFIHFCAESVHTPHSPPKNFYGDKVAGTQLSEFLDMLWEMDLQVGPPPGGHA